ncbi:hypothetical protein [Maribacter sp. 2307UL18-2]|uniref:hypothetical protein n=1 Tax=Maribacter sp. 2307UL18-2 TaxID=3386274 RepID=UPI0039BD0EF1
MENEEQWAEEVLKSLKGMESAVPKGDLFDKIIAEITNDKERGIISMKNMALAAVAASVVVIINIYALKLQSDSAAQSAADSRGQEISLLTEYTF